MVDKFLIYILYIEQITCNLMVVLDDIFTKRKICVHEDSQGFGKRRCNFGYITLVVPTNKIYGIKYQLVSVGTTLF